MSQTPFYLIAHYCNTLNYVTSALTDGANAIELDVGYDENGNISVTHDEDGGGVPIDTYLDGITNIKDIKTNNFCLMIFDCKNSSMPLKDLMAKVRNKLPYSTYKINFIYSTADVANISFFSGLTLQENEAFAVDEADSPTGVYEAFKGLGFDLGSNICYGNGIFVTGSKPSVFSSVVEALGTGYFKFVYAWTYISQDSLKQLINAGASGVFISAGHEKPVEQADYLPDSVKTVNSISSIRFATKDDKPFTDSPLQKAYQLVVKTGTETHAGTDANLTFSITGANGSVSKTINADPIKMFESGRTNLVTILSSNLGTVKSLSVSRDNSGNAPDWYLDNIIVNDRYNKKSYEFNFNEWIGTSASTKTPQPIPCVYQLIVKTSDSVSHAGTDANLTFTIKGENGASVQQTFQTESTGICESGDTNTFYIHGDDVGTLKNLSIYNDDSGNGPGWYPEYVKVTNQTTGENHQFNINQWINGDSTVTV